MYIHNFKKFIDFYIYFTSFEMGIIHMGDLDDLPHGWSMDLNHVSLS
jgi:hypothetical protein